MKRLKDSMRTEEVAQQDKTQFTPGYCDNKTKRRKTDQMHHIYICQSYVQTNRRCNCQAAGCFLCSVVISGNQYHTYMYWYLIEQDTSIGYLGTCILNIICI